MKEFTKFLLFANRKKKRNQREFENSLEKKTFCSIQFFVTVFAKLLNENTSNDYTEQWNQTNRQ